MGSCVGEEFQPWERFGRWIHCICVVTFDLELGQALEVVYPGDAQLSSTEKTNICYLAFPDSNSGCTRDTTFHFRIRRSATHVSDAHVLYCERAPLAIGIDPLYYYGFAHFRQQKDATLPRGYYQKSLILITLLPLFNLYSLIIDTIATAFFQSGEPAVEAACHHIDQWPAPIPGEPLNLPLLGHIIECRIPCKADIELPNRLSSVDFKRRSDQPNCVALSSVHEPDLCLSLGCLLNRIQVLWELVLIGEPIVVMAPSPAISSSLVESLISLIWPLRYFNDFRPFFTIHNSEFREYTSRIPEPPNVILGVTNPFFTKTLQHWPHIVRVGDAGSASADRIFRKSWDGRTFDSKPGFYSQYRPYLGQDKSLMKKLLKSDRPVSVQNAVLRRYLLELTQSFMIPLERYLSSLMPLQKQMSPFKAVPQARPFNVDDFIASLGEAGPALTCRLKGDWTGLYRRFISSLNFEGWFSCRKKDVEHQLCAAHLEVLLNANFCDKVLQSRQHVEIVDLVLKIKDRIRSMDERQGEKRFRLQAQLATIMQSVDDELKSILLSNCGLRDSVQS